jgi:molybdopterin synthase sulfur carrier subunit
MPTVVIPPPYRGPTRGAEAVEVPAGTVAECLDAVEARFPGFRAQVVDAHGHLHPFVKLFRNREQLTGDALAAPIADGDRLEVLAAIAGGSGLR